MASKSATSRTQGQSRNQTRTVRQAGGTQLQVAAAGPRLTFTEDDRPALADLNLPGPRREREGRGGAHATLDVLRYLIRCPLLRYAAAAIKPRGTGRPSAYPDIFWVFFAAASRECASAEELTQELKTHWVEIAKEFYFEHSIALPIKRGVAYASYNAWRTTAIIDRHAQLDVLLDWFTQISVLLALAVRRSEDTDGDVNFLHPRVGDILAGDGTMRNAPSDVRPALDYDQGGNPTVAFPGSRAHSDHPTRARVHEPQRKVSKQWGSPEGLANVAITTKGERNYTRTVLAVDIGEEHDAETPVAVRALGRVYRAAGDAFPVLVYDGALTPVTWQPFMAEHGILTVNANHARNRKNSSGAGESRADDFDADSSTAGEGKHQYGHKRGLKKRTYVTPRADHPCTNGGEQHVHHLAADDGAVYELDRPALRGGQSKRVGLLEPTAVIRLQDGNGEFFFRLNLTGQCARGGTFDVVEELRHTAPSTGGNLSWRAVISNIRVIPEVNEAYPLVMGHRNQVESFFSWLEKRYYRQDRAASWGRDAQIFDLLAAALLHNSETWAHLGHRDPAEAAHLAAELSELHPPDLDDVKPKPQEERKRAKQQRLLTAIPVAGDRGAPATT